MYTRDYQNKTGKDRFEGYLLDLIEHGVRADEPEPRLRPGRARQRPRQLELLPVAHRRQGLGALGLLSFTAIAVVSRQALLVDLLRDLFEGA